MNLIINAIVGIILALVIVWLGDMLGVPQLITGLVALAVFLLVVFRERWYTR